MITSSTIQNGNQYIETNVENEVFYEDIGLTCALVRVGRVG